MNDSIANSLAIYALSATNDDFPEVARRRAKDAITDCIGCMLAGAAEALATMMARVALAESGGGGASVLVGSGAYGSPGNAALYNGTIAHALDYDDTNHPAYAHPSAVLVPALFAVAPLVKATGRELITAYILGLEVVGKLGRALNTAHYERGWHTTATFGTLAATVAVGRLMRLSQEQLVMALGIAASSACGLRANFGTMVKPLHAGYAARNGVLAVLLAREGITSNSQALDHRFGYCNVFNDGIPYDTKPLKSWGEPLEILTEYGLALKPYPSCGGTHPGIEAALILRDEIGSAPIKTIRVGVSEMAFEPLIYVMPKAPFEGKFSMHFCVAAALLDGVVNLATFSMNKIKDTRIHELVAKTTMEVDARVQHGTEFPTVVTVHTESGNTHERLVPLAMGKPERWMSTAQIHEKFMDCGSGLLEWRSLERIFAASQSLDDDISLNPLLDLLGRREVVTRSMAVGTF